MRIQRMMLTLLLMMLTLLLLWTPSLLALNARSAVSVNGLDTNACTPASPCRSFTVAIAATSAGGEVIALDSAGYGPFTVGMSLGVSGAPGVHAAITVSSGVGITVNAGSTDQVVLRNLVLIGAGGSSGIEDVACKEVTVAKTLVRGFSANGILIDTTASNVSVQHCTIIDNFGGAGAAVNEATGGNFRRVAIGDCLVAGNSVGLHADEPSDTVVTDTTFSGNSMSSIQVYATTGISVTTALTAKRCTLVHSNYGIILNAAGQNVASAALSQNVFAFNSLAAISNNGAASTFQNNRFAFNATDVAGTAMTVDALQ